MTHKEIAERLRVLADAPTLSIENRGELDRMANELDPPRPVPGTVVWWRGVFFGASKEWQLGEATREGIYGLGTENPMPWKDAEHKPAHFHAPGTVPVKVPPVSEWPEYGDKIITLFEGETAALRYRDVITRAEAERLLQEAER